MWNDIEDPYERMQRLEAELIQAWVTIEQLSSHIKLQTDLNEKFANHLKHFARGMDHLSTMVQTQKQRIERLEHEKTSSRPIR